MRLPCISTSEKESCHEEAEFLLIFVSSTSAADQPNRNPESFFNQVKDQLMFVTQGGGEGR